MAKVNPFRWSPTLPRAEGYWWCWEPGQNDPSIVRLFCDAGGWSVLYRDLETNPDDEDAHVQWLCNYPEHTLWSGPIPEPTEPSHADQHTRQP